MNILIINITRFGDTLQAQPLLHALKDTLNEKELNIGLVCVENFIEAGQLLQHVSDIFPLPSSYLLKNLKTMDESWLKALNAFEAFTKNIFDSFEPDLIINLTPSVVARLLAKKISLNSTKKSKEIPVYGYALDSFGFSLNSNIWGTYTQAVTLNRLSSPFNLADCFALLGGLELLEDEKNAAYSNVLKKAQNPAIRPTTREEKKQALLLLTQASQVFDKIIAKSLKTNLPIKKKLPNVTKYIAFQLGASAEKRQYSIEHFAHLSTLLIERGYTIVLLGAKNEETLLEKFYLAGGQGISLVGKTDLPLLAAVLRECSLLISNDTGTMHLAASLNIPILALFLATAQAWDTGPISEDACLIEANMPCHPCSFTHICSHYDCKQVISPKVLADIADARLSRSKWPQYFSAQARIWKSQRDEEGFLTLKALDIIDKNPREALYMMQRTVYKNCLELLENKREEVEITISQALDKVEKEKLLAHLNLLCDLFTLLQQQAKLMAHLEKMKHGFLSTNQKIVSLFKSNSSTLPLAYLWDYSLQVTDVQENLFFEIIEKFDKILKAWKNALDNN